jgi:aminoglycoside phosphotransferase family enzyme
MNAGTARALEPEKQQPESISPWLAQLIFQFIAAAAIAGVTWFAATNRMDAVQENRITAVEKELEKKASKESVESIKELINKLDGKVDKLLERRQAK